MPFSIFGSGRAQRHADQMYNLQKQGAQQQQSLYGQTVPLYQQAMQYFAQRANPQQLGPGTSQTPFQGPMGGTNSLMQAFQALSRQQGGGMEQSMQQQAQQPSNGPNRNGGYFSRHAQDTLGPNPYGQGPGGVSNQQMGIWNNPEDALRMAQAQDQIGQYQQGQQRQLQHNLADRGLLDSGAYGAGLTRLADNANQQFADFRRNQAIGAGTEQERRYQQLMGALGPGMGMGQQAQQTYGQLGQLSEQQKQAALAQLSNLFQTGMQAYQMSQGMPSSGGKK